MHGAMAKNCPDGAHILEEIRKKSETAKEENNFRQFSARGNLSEVNRDHTPTPTPTPTHTYPNPRFRMIRGLEGDV